MFFKHLVKLFQKHKPVEVLKLQEREGKISGGGPSIKRRGKDGCPRKLVLWPGASFMASKSLEGWLSENR